MDIRVQIRNKCKGNILYDISIDLERIQQRRSLNAILRYAQENDYYIETWIKYDDNYWIPYYEKPWELLNDY